MGPDNQKTLGGRPSGEAVAPNPVPGSADLPPSYATRSFAATPLDPSVTPTGPPAASTTGPLGRRQSVPPPHSSDSTEHALAGRGAAARLSRTKADGQNSCRTSGNATGLLDPDGPPKVRPRTHLTAPGPRPPYSQPLFWVGQETHILRHFPCLRPTFSPHIQSLLHTHRQHMLLVLSKKLPRIRQNPPISIFQPPPGEEPARRLQGGGTSRKRKRVGRSHTPSFHAGHAPRWRRRSHHHWPGSLQRAAGVPGQAAQRESQFPLHRICNPYSRERGRRLPPLRRLSKCAKSAPR